MLYGECHGAMGQFCWPNGGGPLDEEPANRLAFMIISSVMSEPKDGLLDGCS